MVNIPVFPDSTPEGFYERLLASKALPDSGRPDPQKMAAFLSRPKTSRCSQFCGFAIRFSPICSF